MIFQSKMKKKNGNDRWASFAASMVLQLKVTQAQAVMHSLYTWSSG